MSANRHVHKHVLCCTFNLNLFWGKNIASKKFRTKLFHLHHITISIFITLLHNTTKFGFVPICKEKQAKKCRCKVLSRSWILNIYWSLARLHGIMIKMFILEILSSLPQPLGDNPWSTDQQAKNLEYNFIANRLFVGILNVQKNKWLS